MDIITWIVKNRPGQINNLHDRLEISHESGGCSTLWKNSSGISQPLMQLGEIYQKYDGIDLFSSTFKIASQTIPKIKNNIPIVFCLNDLAKELNFLNSVFPEKVIPFMYQAGIGYYALGLSSGKIFEWDSELMKISEEYNSIYEILDEWKDAVS